MNKSIYKYAAESGVPMGIYLCLMSASLFLSLRFPVLGMLTLPLALGFPIVLGFLIRRIWREEPAYRKLSALWLGGIYTVIFGSLICMAVSGAYVVFVEPGFVTSYVTNVIETLEASPGATEYAARAEVLRQAMQAHLLPSGMEFVTTMAWFTCFAGSIMSLLIALGMSGGRKKKAPQPW